MPRQPDATAPKDSITMTASQRRGQYADVISFAHENASRFGSAVNAVAQAVRESPSYREWLAESSLAAAKKPKNAPKHVS